MSSIWRRKDDPDVRVEMDIKPGGVASFWAEGGGWVHNAPLEKFGEIYEPVPLDQIVRPMHPAIVGADWLETVDGHEVFKCYTDGKRWNGWASPWFTKKEAMRLTTFMPDLKYDMQEDFFYVEDADGERDEFRPEVIRVNGRQIHAYPIGVSSWCWFEEEAVTSNGEED